MAGNREIHGSVVLDVEVEGEERAKARLQSSFAKLEAKVNVSANFRIAQIKRNLRDTVKGREPSVRVDAQFSRAQIQRDLRAKTSTGKPLTARVDAQFSRPQIQKAIRTAIAGNTPTLRVDVDVRRGNFSSIVQLANGAQKEITDFERKEQIKRETQESNSRTRTNDKVRAQQSKGEQDRTTTRERTLRRLDVLEQQHSQRLVQYEAAAAQRREVIESQLRARLEAADRQFEQRRILAAERYQRQLEQRANKPLIQKVLVQTDRINNSLNDFDRTVTRVLRTTLTGFTVWSAGVTAAVTGAVAAGAVAFGRLEAAGTRAGAIVASQVRADELLEQGRAVSNFANVTSEAREKIQANAQAIALATTGFSPTEVIEGTRALLQAGQELPEALKNIGAAARFAQVNEIDLADASDRLAAGLAAAGKGAEYSNKLLDQISFTAQSALGDASDYLEAFANRGASSFRTYGEGIEETLTLLALLGQTGVTGRTAGTQASIVIRDIAKAAAKVPEAFEAYGVAVKSATTPNVTFNETLLSLAAAIEQAQKGNRIAKLRKELGFMDKSFGSILQIIPQVNELGATGLDNFAQGLGTSTGTVNRQVTELNKTLAAQFDKVGDAINIALGKLGEEFGDELTAIFDEFAGPGGLIDQATPGLIRFGAVVAEVFEDVLRYIQSPNFLAAMATLKEAFAVTLRGVADAFTEFASAFDDGTKASSTFEAIADSILAFSRVAATVLPAVARILGTIFDFLIDNADAFEAFAKLTLGIYAVRKAYSLLIKPVATATIALLAAKDAVSLAAATGAGGAVANAFATIATRFGLISTQATAASLAVDKLTASQIANARAANAAALSGSLVPGVGRGAAAKSAAASAGTLVFAGTRLEKFAGTFPRIANALGRVATVFARIAAGGIRFAGIVGLIVTAALGAVQVVRGLVSGFRDAFNASPELEASIGKLGAAFSGLADGIGFVTGIIDDFFFSIGENLGSAVAHALGALGDFLGLMKSIITLDWDGVKENAVSFFQNVAKSAAGATEALLPVLAGIPVIGSSFAAQQSAVNALKSKQDEASGSTRTFASSMKLLESSIERAREAAYQATLTESELANQRRISANVARLAGMASEAAAAQSAAATQRSVVFIDQARSAHKSLIGTVGGYDLTFAGMAQAGEGATSRVVTAAASATAQLLAMQAALQASFGQTASAQQSMTRSLLEQQLANARQGVGPFTEAQALAQIRAQDEFERRQRLIRAARLQQRDQKIISDALGTGEAATPADIPTLPDTSAQPIQRTFTDPDDAIQSAIDRLKPIQKIAQVSALINKLTGDAAKSSDTARAATNKFTGDAELGYNLTRRETLLLAEALPQLDKAIERQREEVTLLDNALNDLRNTQLLGTQAFSDAAFENEQAIKRLQLARLDLLAAGNTDGSQPVIAIDKQIEDLQKVAERAQLEESLQLDPLRRKLEQTFNPVKEDSFENIIAQFTRLSAAQTARTAELTANETKQKLLNDALEVSRARYEKIDAAAQKSVEAFNTAQSAATGTATALGSVGTEAASGARAVNRYSTAVENVPTGKGVVDKSLKGINDRVTELAENFSGAGDRIMVLFLRGINTGWANRVQPALSAITAAIPALLDNAAGPSILSGQTVMAGFLTGLKKGFGSPEEIGSVAWYLNVFIPQWIRENKGPVSYDATILVPAGQAVMEGFGQGLRSGFSQIQGFVKDVGPSLSEFISDDAFSGRTATVMADIAVGKTPDIEGIFGDLRAALSVTDGGFSGTYDPRLAFLHRTLSLKDTQIMAASLAKTFGGSLHVSSTDRAAGTLTSAGNLSAHTLGTAADIGTGGAQPTAESLALFAAVKAQLGSIFAQIIHNGVGLNDGGGSFPDSNHFDHVHLQWLAGKGFDKYSGRVGKPPVTDIPGASDRIDAAISAASARHGVELALLAAVAKQESAFNPNAGSPAGAQGLFQFMPSTARGFGINPLNIEEAADGGARFLKNLLSKFGGRYDLALGGYNAGPNAPGLSEGRLPPYAETRNYVRMVTTYLDQFRKQFGGFRETGGPVQAGKAYVVGEKRPEIFVPNRAGMILPDANATLSGSGASQTYQDNRTITNNVTTAASDPEAVIDVLDARTRSTMTGVNFR